MKFHKTHPMPRYKRITQKIIDGVTLLTSGGIIYFALSLIPYIRGEKVYSHYFSSSQMEALIVALGLLVILFAVLVVRLETEMYLEECE